MSSGRFSKPSDMPMRGAVAAGGRRRYSVVQRGGGAAAEPKIRVD